MAEESALLEQRMRAERHRTNFEALKAQHISLQEANQSLRAEFDTLSENYDRLHRKSQEIIFTLQNERDEKIVECESLKTQVLSPHKLEQLKAQLTDEIEEPYRKRMDSIESELETTRSEYNKLKYNFTFLKSDYEATVARHHSVVEEMTAKHQAEISSYVAERKALLARQERDVPSDLQRIRELQRENTELQEKVKGVLNEIEELRAQKQHASAQIEQSFQAQAQQFAELQALNKTLEVERSSLSGQVQSLQAELSRSHDTQHSASEQLTQAHRDIAALKRRVDEIEHKKAMDISELKMEHLERCRELVAAREAVVCEERAGQAQLEAMQRTLHEQEALLTDRERVCGERVQAAREGEWARQAELQRDKIELEERLAELQRQQSGAASEHKQQLEKLEDEIADLKSTKSGLRSELEAARSQAVENGQHLQSLQLEVQQLSNIARKYHNLSIDYKRGQQCERELHEAVHKLESTVLLLEEQLSRSQHDMHTLKEQHNTQTLRERQSSLEEKAALTARLEEGHAHQQALEEQLTQAKKTSKKLQRHYKKSELELRQSNELLRAREEELLTEREALKKSFGLESQKLKRKFTDMQRKHQEFLFLLHHDPYPSAHHTLPPSFSTQLMHHQDHDLAAGPTNTHHQLPDSDTDS